MDTSPIADVECLRGYARGDQRAFAELYDRHDRRCLDFIRRLIAPPDDAAAEDIHQEVWVAVARHALSFDPSKSRFITWLYTIARNRVLDHLRQSSSARHTMAEGTDDESLLSVPATPGWQPDERLHQQRLGLAIAQQLQGLPQAQRETFMLFALDELSLEEVAAVTQVGVETAKSRLRYARTALRAQLGNWMVNHG